MSDGRGESGFGRHGPWLLVAAAVLFGVVGLYGEFLVPGPEINDRVLHRALTSYVAGHAAEHWTVDCWYPSIAGGFPMFAHYPHLSHLVAVTLSRIAPFDIGAASVYMGLTYLILVLVPAVIYASARKLGLDRWVAALAAAMFPWVRATPFFGIGWESYLHAGSGLLPQVWGVAFIFPALAWGYDAVRTGRCWAAGLFLAAAALSHSLYGYMAALSIGLLLFMPLGGVSGSRRLARLGKVGGIALAASAYFVVPLVLHSEQVLRSQWEAVWKWDSIGWLRVFQDLARGAIFGGLLTVAVAAGVVVAATRAVRSRDVLRAWLVLGLLLWLILFVGRAGWGSVVDLLPLSSGLHMHRFVAGVQVFGLLLAAVGIHAVLAALFARRRAAGIVGVVVFVGLMLALPVAVRLGDLSQSRSLAAVRSAALRADPDFAALVDYLRGLPPGRVHAGMYYDWGRQLQIADIPVYTHLQSAGLDMVGYLFMAMAIPGEWQVRLDYGRFRSYELYNARYLVAPAGRVAPDFAERQRRFGRYAVYEIPTGGYFALGSVESPADGTAGGRSWSETFEIGMDWITGPGPVAHRYLAMDGTVESLDHGRVEGRVEDERVGPGRFGCTVQVPRTTDVVLKATAHPFWRASVDGESVSIVRVFPGFMAVRVPAGQHELEFAYRPPVWKKLLFGFALAFVVVGTALRVQRRRTGKGGGDGDPVTLPGP